MEIAWVSAMGSLRLLHEGTQAGTLWPALSDWLADNDNFQGLWGGLAWCCGAGNGPAMSVLHDVVHTMQNHLSKGRLPSQLLRHPCVAAALSLAIRTVLPTGFTMDQNDYDLECPKLSLALSLIVKMAEAEPQLWQHLHLPALGLWPYLVGAIRRQHEAGASSDNLTVWF